jgi:hypothetical protein
VCCEMIWREAQILKGKSRQSLKLNGENMISFLLSE